MAKVPAYHTSTDENSNGQRNVYHNDSNCSDGKRIKPENKVLGTGNRPLCDECKSL